MKKYISIALFLSSIGFLYPGISQPLLTIEAVVDKQDMLDLLWESLFPEGANQGFIGNVIQSFIQQIRVEGTETVFHSTRSLLGAMQHLMESGHQGVAILIGLFGIVIPVIKIFLNLIALFAAHEKLRHISISISAVLSKWSMSDVFMMAILVAFFAVNANEHAINTVQMTAQLQSGFYYFATYCVLAILAGQLMQSALKETEAVRLTQSEAPKMLE